MCGCVNHRTSGRRKKFGGERMAGKYVVGMG